MSELESGGAAMNNVKTRFVIAISRKLSAAPDSEAKVDLIEELSENLYGRYQDMVAGGMPEEEAYTAALDKLGDVNELLAYLDCCGEQPAGKEGPSGQGAAEDWFGSLGDMIRQTVDQAVDAANDAAAMVREAAKSFEGRRTRPRTGDGEVAFPSEGLRGVSISIAGDLTVHLDDCPDAPVRLTGDTGDLNAVTGPDGVLTVTQDRSAGGSFFFARGLSSDSVELTLPRRHWETLAITTANGDVDICDGVLKADALTLKTTSGDVELEGLEITRRLEVATASGDLELTDSVCGELVFRSASGDLEGENVTAAVLAQTASGDVSLSGDIRALKAATASGDLELDTRVFPESLELSAKSGDCSVRIPDNDGFVFRLHTVSGELYSDFPLTAAGPLPSGWGGRTAAGEGTYKDGGDGRVFSVSSISGDIELRER